MIRTLYVLEKQEISYTAKMVLRASLTGHLVLTSIHAKNGKECISRLEDLGVSKQDLLSVCTAIISQRLYSNGDKKVCVYEIMDQKIIGICHALWKIS